MSGWAIEADDGRSGGERVVLPEGEFGEGGSPRGRESLGEEPHARSPPVGGLELAS